jgi:hypothetical protein
MATGTARSTPCTAGTWRRPTKKGTSPHYWRNWSYYHCQGYATAETNYEYLDRDPTKFHRVFCNQRPYVLGIGIWILFWYHRGCRSSGTQPHRRPQKPGICNQMSHQSRMHASSTNEWNSYVCWLHWRVLMSEFQFASASVTLSCIWSQMHFCRST